MNTQHSQKRILGLLIIGLLGCTKLPETSKLQVAVPPTMQKAGSSSQAVANATLTHVVINVSGEGLAAAKLLEWDSCRDCSVVPPTPSSFEIDDLPSGQKLVQVLAVYSDNTTGTTSIYYGDASKSLSSGADEVAVTVSNVAAGVTLLKGQIAGRYLTSASAGPTGILSVKYKPANRTPMVITRSSMVSGWFNTFILGGVNFSYEVDGAPVFTDVDLTSATFAASSQVLRMHFPAHYRNNNNGWKAEEEQTNVIGYFGSGALTSSKRVCYNYSDLGTTMMYRSLNISGTPLMVYNNTGSTTTVDLAGGMASNSGSCATMMADIPGNLYENMITVSRAQFDNNGGSQAIGFNGIFGLANTTTFKQAVVSYPSANVTKVTTRLLAGIDSTVMNKAVVFRRVGSSDFSFRDDNVPCAALAEGKITDFTRDPIEYNLPTGNSTFAISIPMAKADRSTTGIAICPKKDDVIFPAGMFIGSYNLRGRYFKLDFGDSGPVGTGGVLATRDYCHDVRFTLYEGNDSFSNNDTGLPISVSNLTTTNGTFHNGMGCGSPLGTGTFNIAVSMNQYQLSYKSSANGIGTLGLSSLSFPDIQLDPAQYIQVANPKLAVTGPERIAPNTCNAFTMKTLSAAGTGIPAPSAISSPTKGTHGFSYFDGSSNCGTATPIYQAVATPQTTFYVQGTTGIGTQNLALSYSGYDTGSMAVAMGQGGAIIDKIEITPLMSPMSVNQCNTLRVRLKNYDGAYIPAPSTISFTVATPPDAGSFFSDGGCSTQSNTFVLSSGVSEMQIFFMPRKADPTVAGGISVPISLVNSPFPLSATGGTLSVNVVPNANGSNYIYFDAPTFNGKDIIGSHEFGTSRLVPLHFPAGASVLCSASGTGYSSCASIVDASNNYIWTLTDATSNQQRWFQVNMNGGMSVQVKFQPSAIYGPQFKVVSCSITTGGTSGISTFAGSMSGVTCLPQNTVLSGSCGSGLNLNGTTGVGKSLIGWSDGSSQINASSCSSSPVISMNSGSNFITSGEQRYIANLKILNHTSDQPAIDLYGLSVGQTNVAVNVIGNEIATSGTMAAAIRVALQNSVDMTTNIAKNKVVINGSNSTYGYELVDVYAGNVLFDKNILQSTNSNAYGFYHHITNSYNSVAVVATGYAFDGAGEAVRTAGYGASYMANLTLTAPVINISGNTNSGVVAIDTTQYSNVVVDGARVTGDATNSAMTALMSVYGNSTQVKNSIFVQNANFGFLQLGTNTLLGSFDNNQFVYNVAATPSSVPLNGAGMSSVGVTSNVAGISNNLFCSNSANLWTGLLSVGSLHGSSTWDYATANFKCKKANDVSATNTCKTPCDP